MYFICKTGCRYLRSKRNYLNYLNYVIMEMLDHQKMVLQNVSSDKRLFRKELLKSLLWLNNPEKNQLYAWLNANFGDNYQNLIREVYLKSA